MSSTLLRCGTFIPYPHVLRFTTTVVNNGETSGNKFLQCKHLCFPPL
jgi:hypothetical protein